MPVNRLAVFQPLDDGLVAAADAGQVDFHTGWRERHQQVVAIGLQIGLVELPSC